jgi:hypothetical protein
MYRWFYILKFWSSLRPTIEITFEHKGWLISQVPLGGLLKAYAEILVYLYFRSTYRCEYLTDLSLLTNGGKRDKMKYSPRIAVNWEIIGICRMWLGTSWLVFVRVFGDQQLANTTLLFSSTLIAPLAASGLTMFIHEIVIIQSYELNIYY